MFCRSDSQQSTKILLGPTPNLMNYPDNFVPHSCFNTLAEWDAAGWLDDINLLWLIFFLIICMYNFLMCKLTHICFKHLIHLAYKQTSNWFHFSSYKCERFWGWVRLMSLWEKRKGQREILLKGLYSFCLRLWGHIMGAVINLQSWIAK